MEINGSSAMLKTTRVEHDLLGDLSVPEDALYGVHTLRALMNFPITGIPISTYPNLVIALACVKEAAKAYRTHCCSERRRTLGELSQAMPRGKAVPELLAVKRCA